MKWHNNPNRRSAACFSFSFLFRERSLSFNRNCSSSDYLSSAYPLKHGFSEEKLHSILSQNSLSR
uniref:Uncharacterized protein n=1 Tax=Arundo donax TaxID=35708 RepID=A0A0A9F8V5_ARUDO